MTCDWLMTDLITTLVVYVAPENGNQNKHRMLVVSIQRLSFRNLVHRVCGIQGASEIYYGGRHVGWKHQCMSLRTAGLCEVAVSAVKL